MPENLTISILIGLCVFYLLVMLLNVGFLAYQHHVRKDRMQVMLWSAVAGLFLIHSIIYGWAGFRLSAAESRVTKGEDELRQKLDTQGGQGAEDAREALKESQDSLERTRASLDWMVMQ